MRRITSIALPALLCCCAPGAADVIDFDDYTIAGLPSQDDGSHEVLDSGATLKLSGNAWKYITLPAALRSVEADTVLDLDVRIDVGGEIQGIGFAPTTGIHAGNCFQLYGSQSWGNRTYDYDTPGEWQHFSIPVGTHYTGDFDYLQFVGDHDSGGTQVIYFKDVAIVPEPCAAVLIVLSLAVPARRRNRPGR